MLLVTQGKQTVINMALVREMHFIDQVHTVANYDNYGQTYYVICLAFGGKESYSDMFWAGTFDDEAEGRAEFKRIRDAWARDDKKVLTVARNRSKEEINMDKTMQNEIETLDFSTRTYNALKRAGIKTIADLCGMTMNEIGRIRNLGVMGAREVESALRQNGLKCKEENADDE